MNALREAAQAALKEMMDATKLMELHPDDYFEAMDNLRAALAQEQVERKQLIEKVRVRIMGTALDCADDNEFESYNGVKVMCSDVLEILK